MHPATTFDWNRAHAFLATAEQGTLSAAARLLGTTQPTVGRQVAALEEELGVTLFQRVGNTLELTETGLVLLEHVRTMRDAATRVGLSASGQSNQIDGVVRITASEAISAYVLPPVVASLREDHPGIEIELVPSNDTTDLTRREADIAVRNFRSEEPDLISKKVADSRGFFYASPAYLDRIGRPCTPEALSERAEFFGFDQTDRMVTVMNGAGFNVSQKSFPVRTTNHLVQWEMAKRGIGICAMMESVGKNEPMVEKVLPDMPSIMVFSTWLTCHRELRTSRRLRVVYDRLATHLSEGV